MIDSQKQEEVVNNIINKKWEYKFDRVIYPSLKKYECPICYEILNDPIVHTTCGNIFCRNCINNFNACPLCRSHIVQSEIISAPKMIQELI